MAVAVNYAGRLGNNMIQYAAARMFADKHRFNLVSPWGRPEYFPANAVSHAYQESDVDHDAPEVLVTDRNFEALYDASTIPRVPYRLFDYFQQAKWHVPYRHNWQYNYWHLPWNDPNEEDIGLHVRLTDHGSYHHGSQIIHSSWYCAILDRIKFRKLIIVTDDRYSHGAFDWAARYPHEIVSSPNAAEDFNTLRGFKRVILNNSTFCWAAVMSGWAQEVWQWKRGLEAEPGKESIHPNDKVQLALPWAEQVDGKYQREID